jgi:glycopeptide antibiotics resistance protein
LPKRIQQISQSIREIPCSARQQLARAPALIILVGAVLLPLLLPLPRPIAVSQSLLTGALLNFAHFPLFAIGAFILCHLFRCKRFWHFASAFIAMSAASVVTELLQALVTTRQPSSNDLITDSLGAVAGAGTYALLTSNIRSNARSVRGALIVAIAACLIWSVAPLATPARIFWSQLQAFPELYNGTFPGTKLLTESLGDLDEVILIARDGVLYVKRWPRLFGQLNPVL